MPDKTIILYFSRTTLMGGAENSMYDVIRKTDRRKFRSICILPDDSGLLYKKLAKENIEVIIAKMLFIRQTKNPLLLFQFFLTLIYSNIKLVFIFRKIKPDIIVCNSFQDAFFAAIPAKLLNRKLIINIKNILDKKWKKRIRAKICSLFADRVVASSKKMLMII